MKTPFRTKKFGALVEVWDDIKDESGAIGIYLETTTTNRTAAINRIMQGTLNLDLGRCCKWVWCDEASLVAAATKGDEKALLRSANDNQQMVDAILAARADGTCVVTTKSLKQAAKSKPSQGTLPVATGQASNAQAKSPSVPSKWKAMFTVQLMEDVAESNTFVGGL